MERAIKNETEPGNDWKEYSVSLREKKYDNFRMACGKASKCCVTSEISETETSEKRVAKKKQFSSSEEESGSDLDIPRPQAIKKRLTNQQTNGAAMDIFTDKASKAAVSENVLEETENVAEVLDDTKFKRTCINMMVKVMKMLKECDSKINELSDKLDEVSLSLKNKVLPSEDDTSKDTCLDLFSEFPILNETMLENVERKLMNEKTYKKMVDNLCLIGGRDFKDCSRRFLKKILDDRFAAEYSMQGHKKKKVFRSTRICACLLDAIKRCDRNRASLKEIEVVVSIYLAKSSERLKRKEVISSTGLEEIPEIDS